MSPAAGGRPTTPANCPWHWPAPPGARRGLLRRPSSMSWTSPPRTWRRGVNGESGGANPAGPLHIGSGRNGVIGDVLANVLAALGYDVVREYYINDAGLLVHALAQR